MSSSKISFVSGVVIPALTVIVTVVLFFVFSGQGDKSSLFYFNMCYTVVLELVFFGYLSFARSGTDTVTGAFRSVMGIYSLYYITTGLVVILIYSLAISHLLPIKFYVAAIVVITLVWLILGALIAEVDTKHQQDAQQTMERGHTLTYFTQKMSQMEKQYITLCKELEIPSTTQNYACELSRLTVKFKSLMANVFNSDVAQQKLAEITDKCEALMDSIEQGVMADKQQIADKVKSFTNRSIEEIDLLKTLTRK